MRKAKIFFKDEVAGLLTQYDDGTFTFCYDEIWFSDKSKPPISLTFPKTIKEYFSENLFPFFYNMLPEGSNKQVVCMLNKIDQNDFFGLLITTAKQDNIGAVRVEKIDN